MAPAASKLLRVKRGFAGVSILPGTPLPATAGESRCLGANSAAGAVADTCISPLIGIDVSVYDAKSSLAVMEGTLAAAHPLAQQIVDGRYHVLVNLGGFVTPSGSDTMENGTDPACAPDAAIARKILTDLLSYYQPTPIT